MRELARNAGVAEGTILSRAKREGWTSEIQSAKAFAKRLDAPLAVSPLEGREPLHAATRKTSRRPYGGRLSERGVDHIETMDGPGILDSIDEIEKLDKVARRTFGLKDDNPYTGLRLTYLVLVRAYRG